MGGGVVDEYWAGVVAECDWGGGDGAEGAEVRGDDVGGRGGRGCMCILCRLASWRCSDVHESLFSIETDSSIRCLIMF